MRERAPVPAAMIGQEVGAKLTGLGVYELRRGRRVGVPLRVESRGVGDRRRGRGDGADARRRARARASATSCASRRAPQGRIRCETTDAPARFAMPSSWAGDGDVAIRPDSNRSLFVGPGFRRIVPLGEDSTTGRVSRERGQPLRRRGDEGRRRSATATTRRMRASGRWSAAARLGLSVYRAAARPEHLPVSLRDRRGGVADRARRRADAAHARRRAASSGPGTPCSSRRAKRARTR